ncbi:hypothetical protein LCGC14_1524410 [marine sediment metagenome]|uniref:Uncharacterized protein n=1 Tax=marine sediment metagenome TaxID=412755 RepID=A0A0F9IXQ0_9ZZZZ
MQVLGNSYLIIAEIPVHWMASASRIPKQQEDKLALYPVWLMDSLGTRAAIFVRCPACNASMGLFPSTAAEQQQWNIKEPEISLMMGCANCPGTYRLTNDTLYALSVLPPQKTHTLPRPLTFGVADGNQGMS